jgi:hypothetical protein
VNAATTDRNPLAWIRLQARTNPLRLCWWGFFTLLALKYLALLWWLLQLNGRLGTIPNAFGHDIVDFWLGGRLALDGDVLRLFDPERYLDYLKGFAGDGVTARSWAYPPHYLLLVWPLGLLGYFHAFLAFMAATSLLYLGGARIFPLRLAPAAPALQVLPGIAGFMLMVVASTQNGFLTAAMALFALASMHERPALAGFALACLTMKPQLGLLFPVLLLLDRNWRALAWACAFTALLAVASLIAFGAEPWRLFFSSLLPHELAAMHTWGDLQWQSMPSAFGSARALGAGIHLSIGVQAAASIAGIALLLRFLRRHPQPLARAFALLCCTFIVVPYAFDYDMGALAVTAAALALTRSTGPRWAMVVCGMLAVLPAFVAQLGRIHLPITPLLLLLGLFAAGTLMPSAAAEKAQASA